MNYFSTINALHCYTYMHDGVNLLELIMCHDDDNNVNVRRRRVDDRKPHEDMMVGFNVSVDRRNRRVRRERDDIIF